MALTTANREIRVVVVDDHPVVRAGMAEILQAKEDIEIIGMAANAEEALPLILNVRADVAVVDERLTGMSGVELCRELTVLAPNTSVVMHSAYLDENVTGQAFAAGARAFVLKDASANDLVTAIRRASRGESYLDPKVASWVLGWPARGPRPHRPLDLSPAVARVLRMAIQGNTNGAIARALCISESTVKRHLSTAYRRLEVTDRPSAAAAAVKAGFN
jgi:DNA-binding NarL/FixJ family response regulator